MRDHEIQSKCERTRPFEQEINLKWRNYVIIINIIIDSAIQSENKNI